MTDTEQEFSDNCELTWQEAKSYQLRFGECKGRTLSSMIKTKKRRNLLKYYIGWDLLRDDARENIRVALEHYATLKNKD